MTQFVKDKGLNHKCNETRDAAKKSTLKRMYCTHDKTADKRGEHNICAQRVEGIVEVG